VKSKSVSLADAARRTLVSSVLKRVTNSQAAVLRRRAVAQLSHQGDPAPFLALVGVSLATGQGLLTKQDEIDSVCHEIRRAVHRATLLPHHQQRHQQDQGGGQDHAWSIQDFTLGQPIAQGCNAVVYQARLATDQASPGASFPFAIKMMFNYDAESNALTILRAMQRETLPTRALSLPPELRPLYEGLGSGSAEPGPRLPPHPNVVEMVVVFADQVPRLAGGEELYPGALPRRLHPRGLGRNMSLFLVMRRYSMSLAQYLAQHRQKLTPRVRLLLLAQLLEGVAHLGQHQVAHRDLKADNLLVCLDGGPAAPQLVITDFGSCLAGCETGLSLPFPSWDTHRGGNASLLAPEIARARPGKYATLDYSRSDLWTVGSLGYQIYGVENPFLSGLDTRTYQEAAVPAPPSPGTPPLVARLLSCLLAPRPACRPSPRVAATVTQLLLWAPSRWYTSPCELVSTQDILQWLLTMTTKVVTESRWGNSGDALLEYQLVATFLATLSLQDVRLALSWIQDELEEDDE